MRGMPPTHVVDLFHEDGETSFAAAAQAGIVGIIHKASTGATGQDDGYAGRKPTALQAGLLWGAYHWGTAADVDDQISNFLGVINPSSGPISALNGMLIALDFETTTLKDGSDDTMSLDQARDFITKLDAILHRRVVIYSGDLLKSTLGNVVDPFWSAHRLWLAEYSDPPPTCQASWQTPWLWQFTGSGKCAGIQGDAKGHVDCNTYAGTMAQLRAEWAS
jgi:GH25 family lysozyme M1 (1,4-beta-N-acetylmuramidase)